MKKSIKDTYIIKNKSNLKGTAYVELYPDRYTGTHWNDESIFFEEYHWEFFVPTIKKHYPGYNPYGFQSISSNAWKNICSDLLNLSKRVECGAEVSEIRDEISFMSDYTEKIFLRNEKENLIRLDNTIHELAEWVEKCFKNSNIISILGL
jgi:hypothetical protein